MDDLRGDFGGFVAEFRKSEGPAQPGPWLAP